MRKLFWILVAALSLAACSPQVYPLFMEVRQPSDAGLTLVGKTAAIVYMDGANSVDSLFDRHAASALASALEADYFGGEEVIGLSRIATPDSIGVDLMHTLVMETGGDVIFLLSSALGEPVVGKNMETKSSSLDSAFVCQADVPINTTLYLYDSMGNDEVTRYKGSATLKTSVYNNGIFTEDAMKALALRNLMPEAEDVGLRISRRFQSNWLTESFSFYYFDDFSSETWFTPLQDAADGKYAKAIRGWEALVKDGSSIKRACACFNIAQAFYLLGDYVIASRWLDEAEKMENLTQAQALRKRLASHLEK